MTLAAQSRVFVDGNNVMGSQPDGWWRDRAAAARRLVAEIIPTPRRFAPTGDQFDRKSVIGFTPESVINFTGMRSCALG